MKRIAAVAASLVLLAGLTGCSSTDDGPTYINCAWFVADDGYLAPFFCDESPELTAQEWCESNGSYFFEWMDPQGNQEYICSRSEADIEMIKEEAYREWVR